MYKSQAILFLLLLSWLLFFPNLQYAIAQERINEHEASISDELLETLELDELNKQWNDLQKQYEQFLPTWSEKNIAELIKDSASLSFTSLFKGIVTFVLFELIENGKLLGTLLILTLFSVLLQATINAFGDGSVSKIAQFVIFSVLIYLALQSFYLTYTYTNNVMEQMSSFMVALLPLLLAIIASSGQLLSVAFFHPLIIIFIQFSTILLAKIIFPLLFIAALFMMISQFNESFKLDQLASLLRTLSLGSLGIYVTVLLTIMSVQGTVTAIHDGVALKTTKFIAGNFIPVIGKTLTEATDTILSAALLLKNALGVVGLFIIVTIAVFPALKIAVLAFIYKLVAGLLQPLGNSSIVQSLAIISQYMMYILACLIFMTLMFFLTIVIIIVSSNIPLLLR